MTETAIPSRDLMHLHRRELDSRQAQPLTQQRETARSLMRLTTETAVGTGKVGKSVELAQSILGAVTEHTITLYQRECMAAHREELDERQRAWLQRRFTSQALPRCFAGP